MPGRSRKEGGGTDARWGEEGRKGGGGWKGDICVYRHASSFVRSRNQRPPQGALPLVALPIGT